MDSRRAEKAPERSPLVPVLDALESTFSQNALEEIQPLLQNTQTTVELKGQRVTLKRDQPAQVPLNGEFLNGQLKITSLDVSNVSFDIDRVNKGASNIDGISVNITVFGTPQNLAVEKLRVIKDANGQRTLHTEMINPMPEPTRRLVGMPRTMVVQFPITDNGLGAPVLSKVFADAATSAGPTIGGLLAKDALTEASKVALFVESNPEWVSNVVQPALKDIYNQLSRKPRIELTAPDNDASGVRIVSNQAAIAGLAKGIGAGDATPPKEVQPPGKPAIEVNKAIGDHVCTMNIKGVERTFRVHVPPSYNGTTPMPLVILLHGHGQTGEEIARHTKMTELADKEGFIAIYPDARTWAGKEQWRAWDTDNGLIPPGSGADDVGFLRKIIESAEKDYAVDAKRIFLTGLSNGGMLAFRAAGELSDKVAAIAVVSGAMSGREPPPKFPISVLNIHGTSDGIVPYNGLKNVPASLTAVGLPKFKPMEYATEFWKEQNKITTPAIVLKNGDVTQRRFINCDTGAEVSEYTIHNGQHVPDNVDQLTGTIWNFLKSHPRATGAASEKAQPPEEAPFNITERLKAHVQTRGFKGIELDIGQALNEVHYLGNGSISPRSTLTQFEDKSGISLNDGVSSFLKKTDSVSKSNTRISIALQNAQQISIDQGSGPIGLKSIYVDSPTFDLVSQNDLPSLRNIEGVTLNMTALGRDVNIGVREASQLVDAQGNPFYRLKTDSPLPRWARIAMFADSQIPVELRMDDTGQPSIMNEQQIKNATLGWNPITRGYIDAGTHAYNLYERPTLGQGLEVATDAGILGATAYGGYRLAAMKLSSRGGRYGAAAAATLLVAPSIIHGVESLDFKPISRGYTDVSNHLSSAYEQPSLRSGLSVAKDGGILGATAYGSYKLAALKFGSRGGRYGAAAAATLILAPSIIHGVERIFE